MTIGIEEQLSAVAKALKCKFTLKGEPIEYEKVFKSNGLLPPIMRRADQLASFCFGTGLGVSFERAEGLVGVKVEFDSSTSDTLKLLCAVDVLIEIIQGAPTKEQTPLDELMAD